MRVAVIDSGVFASHPHINGDRVLGGASFGPSGASFVDTLGHGTAVMAAIQEKAPEAECYALRVFHNVLRTRVEYLLEALEWCVDNKMDIANLSLGTANPDHAPRFEAFLKKAPQLTIIAAAGALPGSLAASQHAPIVSGQPVEFRTSFSLSADFSPPNSSSTKTSIIPVDLDLTCPRETFRYRAATNDFAASGYPRPIPGVPVERNLQGISFAVANLTGFAAKLAATGSGPQAIRQILIDNQGLK